MEIKVQEPYLYINIQQFKILIFKLIFLNVMKNLKCSLVILGWKKMVLEEKNAFYLKGYLNSKLIDELIIINNMEFYWNSI